MNQSWDNCLDACIHIIRNLFKELWWGKSYFFFPLENSCKLKLRSTIIPIPKPSLAFELDPKTTILVSTKNNEHCSISQIMWLY